MRDCRRFNTDGTPTKRNGGTGNSHKSGHCGKSCSQDSKSEGANFAQITPKEVKKAFHKKSSKHKKCHANDSDSDSDSDYSM